MRKSKLNKISKAKIPTLKRKLWSLLSKWIRERDKFVCFTCGRKGEGKGIHAGHCIPKSICGKVLEFSPINLAAQCYNCNINLGGNGAIFGQKLQLKYGYDVVAEMNRLRLAHKGEQWEVVELETLINCLKNYPENYDETYEDIMNI